MPNYNITSCIQNLIHVMSSFPKETEASSTTRDTPLSDIYRLIYLTAVLKARTRALPDWQGAHQGTHRQSATNKDSKLCMSRCTRKPTICICENKDVKRLCFRYTDSTIHLLSKRTRNFKLLSIFCSCTGRFVSDLIGNQIVGFPMHRLIKFVSNSQLVKIDSFSFECS